MTFLAYAKSMVNVYLLVTIIGRGIFIFFFMLDHFTLVKGKDTPQAIMESRRMRGIDWAWFFGKESMFIMLGFLHFFFMLMVTGYSLMLAGSHAVACARRSKYKVSLVFGWIICAILKYMLPIGAIVYTAYESFNETGNTMLVALAGVIIAIGAFSTRSIAGLALKKKRYPNYTIETALKAAKRTIIQKIPRGGRVIILIAIIVCPLLFYFYLDATVGMDYFTIYIPTTGGYSLATDVYRIRDAGPQPVVLIRTPYGKGDFLSEGAMAYQFVEQGYTVVFQDMRGRFASMNDANQPVMQFLNDYYDGRTTVSWIKNQSWCNGNISSYGASAVGINQYEYADEPTGALKFQDIEVATPEIYTQMLFPGGAFRKGLVEGWLAAINASNSPTRTPDELTSDLATIFDHPLMNGTFYNTMSLATNDRYANIHASAIHIGGWYDIFDQGIIDGFSGYQYNGGTGAYGHQRLIMGPIGHGAFGGLAKDGLPIKFLEFPNPTFSLQEEWENEMRDAACQGMHINWSKACVAYYLMGDVDHPGPGANLWHTASQWPLPDTNNVSWYLNGNMSLTTAPAATNKNNSFLYNPVNPVPTIGGNNLFDITTLQPGSLGVLQANGRVDNFEGIGPYDQNETLPDGIGNVLLRPDVLVYSSPVLSSPLTVTGRVTVRLNVTTNCTDTAFTAKLMDEYSNGNCFNILDGIQVLSARNGPNIQVAAVNGKTYSITIDLWSTAYQFNTGHRIVLAISSSNYPRFERNPNKLELPNDNPEQNGFCIANNTICIMPITGSALELPVST